MLEGATDRKLEMKIRPLKVEWDRHMDSVISKMHTSPEELSGELEAKLTLASDEGGYGSDVASYTGNTR